MANGTECKSMCAIIVTIDRQTNIDLCKFVFTTHNEEKAWTPRLVSLSAAAALVRKLIQHAERKVRSLKRVPSGI